MSAFLHRLHRCLHLFLFPFAALVAVPPAHSALTVLVEEPFGNFGTMMPVGHTAVYLDRVCADGPFRLRMCQPGELQGVAVARYARLGPYDWLASPIMQFLYAVDRPEDVPTYVTPELAWSMRQSYRHRFLNDFIPDGREHSHLSDEWWESAGVTFNRRVWGYQIDTTPEQDEAFVAFMNADANHSHYKLRGASCANFAADVINFYFPNTVHADKVADFGLMTPKQVARSLAAYGQTHPDARFRVPEFPQLPGSLRRSRPVRGGAESGLKTKRYLATLLVIQPEVPATLTVLYLVHGRWQVGKGAQPVTPSEFASSTLTSSSLTPPLPSTRSMP